MKPNRESMYREEAQARKQQIESEGGVAWVIDEYGRNMSGATEYMATSVYFFTLDELREHVARHER